ncbi:MAG: FGGY family carbohydrate kinase, partial [Parcubacteria group bacterium]
MTKNIQTKHFLVLDIGTTGVKALVFTADLKILTEAYQPLDRITPQPDWVEQDPIWYLTASQSVLRQAMRKSKIAPENIAGLGITNQRETTILWDKDTNQPVYNAIVWEDKRTAKFCDSLQAKYDQIISDKTGLCLDPYFSASKIWWLLENVPEAKGLADKNKLAFGTVDSWVLSNWLEGDKHLTDSTNASRTLLYDVRRLQWDKELAKIFNIPLEILPAVKPSSSQYGQLKSDILGFKLPVLAVCGDQQASTYAAGTENGTTKITYGTGTFLAQQIGDKFVRHGPFFTMLLASQNKPVYAVEGKVESSAREVDVVLDKPTELRKVVTKIARQVDKYIQQLPIKPEKIMVDGGITKYDQLT